MPIRIGGPETGTPATVPPCTWGSMRSPIVLNGFLHGASYTRYSRAWPSSSSPVKFFKWESGSLFRQRPYSSSGPAAPPLLPYYWIGGGYNPDTGNYDTSWGLGIVTQPYTTVDNHDFLQLIGEDLDTDIGTYTINADAHSPTSGGQYLGAGASPGTEIYAIGKLTGF